MADGEMLEMPLGPRSYRVMMLGVVIAEVSPDGRLFMVDDATGDLVESYDWSRFGRLVYAGVSGRKPPEPCGFCLQLPCRRFWNLSGEGPRRCGEQPEAAWPSP